MKITKRIDSYNIKSLEKIKDGVRQMNKHCDTLDSLGTLILNNIKAARNDGFDDINCDRAEEIILDYKKTLNATKEEFQELSDSIKEFTNIIDDYWSSWR